MKKRRKSEQVIILSPEEIDEICRRAKTPRDACLIALLYLSGRRINEVLPLQKKHFTIRGNLVFFETFNEKSYRLKPQGDFQIPRQVKFKNYEGTVYYQSITPFFSLTSKSGRILGHYVMNYLRELDSEDYLFKPSKNSKKPHINMHRAYQILRELDDRLWLHALRHMRFTLLAKVYREDPISMHRLTFHRKFESTLEYIHREEDLKKIEEV